MIKGRRIKIGTRGSKLALIQAEEVAGALKALYPHGEIIIKRIKTKGDRILPRSLGEMGGKGIFVKEIELALLKGEVDLAVHSMKDMPTEETPGTYIAAITRREDPHDVLISKHGLGLNRLPRGAKVGTGSPRRSAQLLHYRPDLKITKIRGNSDTRIKALNNGDLDAIVVALAGLRRMGWEDMITEVIPLEICLPAAGQGSLGVQTRSEDATLRELVGKLDHPSSRIAITAERSFSKSLGGGCRLPLGVLGRVYGNTLELRGVVLSPDGQRLWGAVLEGAIDKAEELGIQLAQELLRLGPVRFLKRLKKNG